VLTSEFDFALPNRLIAQRPAPRGTSRMMVLDPPSSLTHKSIGDLPLHLRAGDLLVVNDTRVIPARLFAQRVGTEGRVELLLVEKTDSLTWRCLVKPGRGARIDDQLELAPDLTARIEEVATNGQRLVRFSQSVEPFLESLGIVPLPPYIKRSAEEGDADDYQTIFARHPGAIAAPTAGLHFSPALIRELEQASIGIVPVTLHVGIGTFKPVTAELAHEHRMDAERFDIPPASVDAIRATKSAGGRVIAIGTTVVRTLEGAVESNGGTLEATTGRTNIFIRPGFQFQVVDALLTNFHLPRSTLLMLVSAFAGREYVLEAYRQAVDRDYRFFSYGDAMFLPQRTPESAADLQRGIP
jgi:S-adenosylmethionine:tRNA ribosyltransferase-isomerase